MAVYTSYTHDVGQFAQLRGLSAADLGGKAIEADAIVVDLATATNFLQRLIVARVQIGRIVDNRLRVGINLLAVPRRCGFVFADAALGHRIDVIRGKGCPNL